MADMNDLARMLFPSARDVIIEALGDMPDVSVTAVVTQGSEDGVARVDFLGESTSGNDEEASLEIPTSDHLEEGDEIVVTMKGGVPIDARRIGSGDKIVLRIDQTESDITYNFSVYRDYTEANDAAVLKAYGWPTDLSEPEIVSRLFNMYEKLTNEEAK